MNNNINWGIIGLGNIAHQFAKSLILTKNARLFAVASNTKKKLDQFKNDYNILNENCYANYEKLISNKNVDIVYIALPNSLHQEWIMKCIEFNKNILVEKPAFIHFGQAEEVFSNPALSSIFLGEGFMFRYHPQIKKVVDLIKSDKIGNINSMNSNFGINLIRKKKFFGLLKKKIDTKKRIFNKELGGGAIFDLGSYTISMALLIASLVKNIDLENFKIQKLKNIYELKDVDTHSCIDIVFDNKFEVNLQVSFAENIGNTTTIVGEKGKIIIENSWSPDLGKIKVVSEKEETFNLGDSENIYSLLIENISNDIKNKKIEASYPGMNKKEILINSKILHYWKNEKR